MTGQDGFERPKTWLPAWAANGLAWRRQRAGLYDDRTRAYFRDAWHRGGTTDGLMSYLQFVRELGERPDTGLLDALGDRLPSMEGRRLSRAVGFLLESGAFPDDRLGGLVPRLRALAGQSPPIAAWMLAGGEALPTQAGRLAEWHLRQPVLREEFSDFLNRSQEDLCVVGNAGSLLGAGLGARIDSHPLVVRFNRCFSDAAGTVDLGRRLDVKVCAPGFLPEQILMTRSGEGAGWLVLSGPDARYQRAGAQLDWRIVQELLEADVQVLTVPLGVWGDLVRTLGAPPSAGVLLLAWLHDLLGGWERLSIAGFDSAQRAGCPYHHAGRRVRAGRRHAWVAERAQLQTWEREGLRSLDSTDQG